MGEEFRAILAVDPGYNFGWAVIDRGVLKDFGSGKGEGPEAVWSTLQEFQYDFGLMDPCLVVEQQPLVAVKSGIVANGLRGMAYNWGWDFAQISSSRVKKLVAGYGRATKEQVKKAVEEKFGVECANFHESDSIAVGLAYIIMKEEEESVGKAVGETTGS